jgi:hypothetical protein
MQKPSRTTKPSRSVKLEKRRNTYTRSGLLVTCHLRWKIKVVKLNHKLLLGRNRDDFLHPQSSAAPRSALRGGPPQFASLDPGPSMSIASLQNEWLKDAPARIPLGRASAKSTLIARHNYKGESVFQARRQWHSSRAYADAAHRRLVAAMAELEAARRGEEEAECTLHDWYRTTKFRCRCARPWQARLLMGFLSPTDPPSLTCAQPTCICSQWPRCARWALASVLNC